LAPRRVDGRRRILAPQPASRRPAMAAQTLAFAAEGGSSGVADSLWRAGSGGGSRGDARERRRTGGGRQGAVAAEQASSTGGGRQGVRAVRESRLWGGTSVWIRRRRIDKDNNNEPGDWVWQLNDEDRRIDAAAAHRAQLRQPQLRGVPRHADRRGACRGRSRCSARLQLPRLHQTAGDHLRLRAAGTRPPTWRRRAQVRQRRH
jgi:hypothetical protein